MNVLAAVVVCVAPFLVLFQIVIPLLVVIRLGQIRDSIKGLGCGCDKKVV